jgi:regulator of sigma E protease
MMLHAGFLMFIFDLAKFLLALSALVIVHEWGHFIAARRCGVRVEIFSIGFGRRLFTRKSKGTEFTISAVPMGGYVKMAGDTPEEFTGKPDEFLAQPARKRVKIIVAGPLMNYLLGFLLFSCVYLMGYPAIGTRVGEVIKGMGAESAGIRAGDTIVAIDNKDVQTWDDLVRFIRAEKGRESIRVTIVREGVRSVLTVGLRQGEARDELMQRKKVGQIGIKPSVKAPDDVKIIRYGLFKSFEAGAQKTVDLTILTYKALGYMIFGKLSMSESMTGPVGMFEIYKSAKTLVDFFVLSAVVSVSLALFNLLPLPILDGGHIFFLALEKIRRKPISKKTEDFIVKIGLALLISIAVLVSVNDVRRLGYVQKITERLTGRNHTQAVPDGSK